MSDRLKNTLVNLDRFARLGMVLGVVVLISFLYPNNIKFKYEFQKGQTWQHEDLYAPFDFAIKKPTAQLQSERERLQREFSPYYIAAPNLLPQKLRALEEAIQQKEPAFKDIAEGGNIQPPLSKHIAWAVANVADIYKKGIIQLDEEHEGKGKDFVVNVLDGNTTYKRTLPGLYTVESAKATLDQGLRQSGLLHPVFFKELLHDAIAPNLTYDKEITERFKSKALSELVTTKGVVTQNESIIKKGELITDELYERLNSFRDKYQEEYTAGKSAWVVYFGYLLLTTLVLGAFMMYVHSYRREIFTNWQYLAFVLMWLLIFSYMTFVVERTQALSAYVIPYCIAPVVIRHFFTYRLAFFTHVVVVLIAGFLTSLGYQFMFMQIVAGVVAVLAVADARDWTKFFRSILYILLTYAIAYLGLSLIEEGDFREVDWSVYNWLLFNGLLILLAFPLIPLMERLFGFTSAISLVELADLNRPLLRELAIKATGTFNHSIQVANLAEAGANEIGANSLLVRVGALYHDIGKLKNPAYFIENQGNVNPHEFIDCVESAHIILGHVAEGVKMAKKHHLPAPLINFIKTHHGTTRAEYFYRIHLKENPSVEVDENLFTYPGPLPVTKEEALLMLADATEATARSLKNPTGEDIDEVVDKIFKSKIGQHQFDMSKITLCDIEVCRKVFKKMLRSIYHVRVEYPEEVNPGA